MGWTKQQLKLNFIHTWFSSSNSHQRLMVRGDEILEIIKLLEILVNQLIVVVLFSVIKSFQVSTHAEYFSFFRVHNDCLRILVDFHGFQGSAEILHKRNWENIIFIFFIYFHYSQSIVLESDYILLKIKNVSLPIRPFFQLHCRLCHAWF